jgi:hypothetical protein
LVAAEFAFEVADAIALDRRRNAQVTLVGPLTFRNIDLAVGDRLSVPTLSGDKEAECMAFPLVNLGPERVAWVRVTVHGVGADEVLVGGTARRVEEG